jgi:thiamine-monophosphate kinase
MVKRRQAASSEEELIARIRRRTALPELGAMVMGIGDDCAIFRPRGGSEDLLFTTDMLIEGTHFLRETHSAADVGWKALARGLSDIAAMGGEPRFCLVSLALAPWTGSRWVDGFYDGLIKLASREAAPVAGGDLSHAERVMCDIVVCGAVPRGRALRRDGARPGDAIYVSGALGGAALRLAKRWKPARPEPRLALGRFLREELHATAAMDLSDGISLDLRRMCLASNTAAEIGAPPRYRGATLEQALDGGEDYELLFTVRDGRVPARLAGLPLTRIGTMRKGPAGAVSFDGVPLAARGYDHFRPHLREL